MALMEGDFPEVAILFISLKGLSDVIVTVAFVQKWFCQYVELWTPQMQLESNNSAN